MKHASSSRREFLKKSVAASAVFAVPTIIPASALGKDGRRPPSERIVMGCIGTGGQGIRNMRRFMNEPEVQVVAVCDVDERHRDAAKMEVQDKYGCSECRAYDDFRELLTDDTINAVSIATPDHWHALTSIAAADAGKHIYCEKPLANSVGEGRAIVDAVKRNDVLLQTGSHERSNPRGRYACSLVQEGKIGNLKEIRILMPTDQPHHQAVKKATEMPEHQPVPEGFDYDFWLGHTAEEPYNEKRCHFWWRFILAYGGGEMTDRGAHIIDLAQLGARTDDTGPVRIEATGSRNASGLYDAFMDYRFENTYAGGVKMIVENRGPRGLRFIGDEGSVFVHVHGCKLEGEPKSLIKEKKLKKLSGVSHHRNFVDALTTGAELIAPAEVGHRTATICHLNNIAMTLGRPLEWDPDKEHFVDDQDANALLTPKMREPWKLS